MTSSNFVGEPVVTGTFKSGHIFKSVKRAVLSRARRIYGLVKVDELLPELITPDCCFVTPEESERLNKISGDYKKARELLLLLKRKRSRAARKFVACLILEPEHSGHQELATELIGSLSRKEQQRIKRIVAKVRLVRSETSNDTAVETDTVSIEKPLPPIELQGPLKGKKFTELDQRLWLYLRESRYELFYKLTARMRERSDVPEYQIVGMWFESLAYVHTDKDHQKCVSSLLKPALELCKNPRVNNNNILEGRLHQRMSQVLLMLGNKHEAVVHFRKTESLLQFVGRGYDKVQLFLRKAKILSATEPQDKYVVEKMYNSALENISDDDPFAFSCQPSAYLSKAAFHLGISFGSKPLLTVEPPDTPQQNIDKAREALTALSLQKIQLFSMRQFELELVAAELLRLEGKNNDALEVFKSVKQRSRESNLDNLVAVAEHRIMYLESEILNDAVIDELLVGLPGEEKLMKPDIVQQIM